MSGSNEIEQRLFFEELVCNLFQFRSLGDRSLEERLEIRQEARTGVKGVFADLLVENADGTFWLLEVNYGYGRERMIESLERKLPAMAERYPAITKLVVFYSGEVYAVDEELRAALEGFAPRGWEIELWDHGRLFGEVRETFGVEIGGLSADDLHEYRLRIDHKLGEYAMGDAFRHEPLDAMLLWHLGFRRLKRLWDYGGEHKRSVFPSGEYAEVVVLFCDLSGFSGYVRDTINKQTIPDCLSRMSTKFRHQILNSNGMVYQFLGDSVIGLFGMPDKTSGYVADAFGCAKALLEIGESISHEWQRDLDRVQPVDGVHIGMAMGNLQMHSHRPFSRTHLGASGDSINLAARLCSHAGPNEIALSNRVYRRLPLETRRSLRRGAPVEAKNVGLIQPWIFEGEA